jgi:hypothetical protein
MDNDQAAAQEDRLGNTLFDIRKGIVSLQTKR